MTELPYVANEATDFFKFFVTSQPTDFSVLTQAASRDPDLDRRLLAALALAGGSEARQQVGDVPSMRRRPMTGPPDGAA
ncbi:MAG: hypothetical protein IPO15_17640 [Anaerolineae bacterium]|uniref:hypothetical protein n=1 Tax=Candidatus Amarolinea dominans TaxID=3140696 RepID=UPI00313579BE|nr:hypothetical protein [Anaerolineae bacterium]